MSPRIPKPAGARLYCARPTTSARAATTERWDYQVQGPCEDKDDGGDDEFEDESKCMCGDVEKGLCERPRCGEHRSLSNKVSL